MKTIKAALIVQNCIAGDFNKNLESTCKFLSLAKKQDADIIVFPEMNLTGYVTDSDSDVLSIARPLNKETSELFSKIAKDFKATILVGLAEETTEKKIYASHLIFHQSGAFDIYRKIHLAPYEKKHFTAGNRIPVFESHGLKFGVQLCYDAHFPELTLAMALKQAEIIFMPHASPRGSSKDKFDSWIRHLRARAFDNSIYIAACNQTGDNLKGLVFPGVTIFIGPDGNVLYKSIDDKPGLHIIDIKKSALDRVRSHKMRYFLPNRRSDLFNI